MKKIIIAMAAIAAALTMASCNKEQPVSPNDNPTVGKSVITASIENDLTKAFLEGDDTKGYEVYWSEGDKFVVFDMNESWGAEYTLDKSSAGSSKGAFIWQEGDFFITEDDYDEPKFENNHTYVAEYPSEIFNDSIWKTEQTYDETDIYIPMFGEAKCTEDGAADFTFTNLGGLLRLNVKGTATIKSITVRAKEPMSGHILDIFCEDDEGYKVAFISDWAILFTPDTKNYINLDCGKNGVKLSPEGTDFYISMPCHYIMDEEILEWGLAGYSDVTITLTDTEGRTCVKKLNNKKLFIERSQITTATFTASEFKANVPEGALPGKFSVSADKKVHFSQGNLTYNIKTSTWAFYEHQYDCATGYDSNLISLFTWGYDATKSIDPDGTSYVEGHAIDGESFNKNEDWGYVFGGESSVWRTLTKDEWTYLFNTTGRMVNGKPCYSNAVSGVTIGSATYKGVFLYPDNYNGEVVSSGSMTWDQINAAGIVFLPAAGRRYGPNVSYVGGSGHYWSSTARDSNYAYLVSFSSSAVSPGSNGLRNFGFSVRLITESK